MKTDSYDTVRAVEWAGDHVSLLDQRLLPGRTAYLACGSAGEVAAAITDMVVRGAPAIGVTAAYGVVLAARAAFKRDPQGWKTALTADIDVLAASRPTAINLTWAIRRMEGVICDLDSYSDSTLLNEACRIHDEDIAGNRKMGELGAGVIESCEAVLTHCNTGSLATGGYGTALGVIRSLYTGGKIKHVYADETRPWLQGSRLTAWELVQDGIPVSLLADGAAAHLLKSGKVGWVIVGADRVAANGDAANKIGTYGLAVVARYHGVRFMVVAPTSTIDMNVESGAAIPIEERPAEEVLVCGGNTVAATGASAWNPVFDVTPASLVDAYVSEKGVVMQPDAAAIARLMGA